MRLAVVGSGYVGLVSGACLADIGHDVICIDSDPRKIEILLAGGVPIFEPGLEQIIAANRNAGRLTFSGNLRQSLRDVRAVFLAVGTPSRDHDGCPDLAGLYDAARDMALAIEPDTVVVVKSTVPVGTGDEIECILREAGADDSIAVVSNPEFLRAGAAVRDFLRPDRIVIGAQDRSGREVMTKIYQPLSRAGVPVVHTSRRSSELIKYGSNTLLATKIAFINELADLCEHAEADITDVARGMGLDSRIGPAFLNAGPGFGGSCFRKDALALVRMGEQHQASMRVAEAVLASNEARKRSTVRRISAATGKPLRGCAIGVLGLTFKPNTDDMRESPSIPLICGLIDAGAAVRVYDPSGHAGAQRVLPGDVIYAKSPYAAATDAEALVVITEWDQFRNLDLDRLKRLMAEPVIVDMRNIFRPEDLRSRGFRYHRIGAAPHAPEAPRLHALPRDARRGLERSSNGSAIVLDERKRRSRAELKAASPAS
jgi:UDPglucose 6-dehydrogenase